MNAKQALTMLYNVTRRMQMTAEDHERCRTAAVIVEQELKSIESKTQPGETSEEE